MAAVRLHLDGARWREHLRTVAGAAPGLVPVIKGNGYGYGLGWLAAESAALGVDVVAVGTATEVPAVADRFAGDIVILNPYDPASDVARRLAGISPAAGGPRPVPHPTRPEPVEGPTVGSAPAVGSGGPADIVGRVITTVSRLSDLESLAVAPGESRPRVLVELLTSMQRHGMRGADLGRVRPLLDRVRFEGWSIHLPLLAEGRYAEAERLSRLALATAPGPLWLSHLPAEETSALARQLGGARAEPVPVRLRIGTRLWLGEETTRRTTATVLDVHPIKRGERAGYRQRVCPADGWIVVMAGGTSHGIGMEAPTAATSVRQRAIALATGSLEAAGFALSPYTIDGKKRWFLEPPHMQSSLLFLPARATPPAVGDEVPVELRLTTANVDEIVVS